MRRASSGGRLRESSSRTFRRAGCMPWRRFSWSYPPALSKQKRVKIVLFSATTTLRSTSCERSPGDWKAPPGGAHSPRRASTNATCHFVSIFIGLKSRLFCRVRRHLLDHGEHEFAVAVVESDRVAANLAEEADFVVGELRQSPRAVAVSRLGKELREGKLHGAGDFRKRIERGNGVSVLDAREITAQQAGALFDVALRHAFLQAVVPDGFADIHSENLHWSLRGMAE